ncbi:MAG TPA: response regulator transcription factor [Candidatus Limnocylindrales bacterium]|nr:response regulator transcription factor [Candidatus Limnocylindrales bacterium]
MSRADDDARRLRVVVVDADRRVRDSLSGLLELGDELEVVGQAGQPGAALDLCAERDPDVVIVDPRLPDVDAGAALVMEVRARFPGTVVLVLSWPGSATDGDARAMGADGVLSKSAAPHELAEQVVALVRVARPGRARGGRPGAGGTRC